MTDFQTKTVQVLRCGYKSPCRVQGCSAAATVILRGLDNRGQHTVQWEVCDPHSEQAILRKATRGKVIVRLSTGSD